MLDENLPTFVLKPSSDKPKQHLTYLYSQWGAEFEPSYSLRHPDPEQLDSKNRYAAALYDAHNPDVLFGEVLLVPQWTQPTLSADQIRLNGGVPPPPEPTMPTEFTIQLYNPDQQVVFRQKPGSWAGTPSWDFEMPQQSFRTPSTSSIDRSQDDPTVSELTPKINFRWRKDSRLSKDLVCSLRGRSTNPDGSKRKNREPDITVAIFKGLREMTLYEPNLQRVEIEDTKGFEVVLLLGSVVIRDVFFGHLKETFNIAESRLSPVGPKVSMANPLQAPVAALPVSGTNFTVPGRVPPTDPRSQWEIEAETALLKRQAAEEEREHKRKLREEEKRVKKMVEIEEKEQRRRQAEIDKETERLKRVYGQEDASARPALPLRHSHDPSTSTYGQQIRPQQQQQPYYPPQWTNNQHLVPGGQAPPHGGVLNPYGGGGPPYHHQQQQQQQHQLRPKTSFFGFGRRSSDAGDDSKLNRKRSSVF